MKQELRNGYLWVTERRKCKQNLRLKVTTLDTPLFYKISSVTCQHSSWCRNTNTLGECLSSSDWSKGDDDNTSRAPFTRSGKMQFFHSTKDGIKAKRMWNTEASIKEQQRLNYWTESVNSTSRYQTSTLSHKVCFSKHLKEKLWTVTQKRRPFKTMKKKSERTHWKPLFPSN